MRALWCYVGAGETIDAEGTVRWSIDWAALDMAFRVGHPLTTEDYADEIFDALVYLRNELNTKRPNPSLSMLAAAHPAMQAAANG